MSRAVLLQRALAHIPQHGFTRLSLSLASPQSPLSETAITALFGRGAEAERVLVRAWLEEGRQDMRRAYMEEGVGQRGGEKERLVQILARRLRWNEPVLPFLADALALISSPSFVPPFSLPVPLTIPRFRPLPGLAHVASVADEACWLLATRPPSPQAVSPSSPSPSPSSPPSPAQPSQTLPIPIPEPAEKYYLTRAHTSTIYALTELHQLSSPTAEGSAKRSERFMRDLVGWTEGPLDGVKEVAEFAGFVGRSWAGILRSRGI